MAASMTGAYKLGSTIYAEFPAGGIVMKTTDTSLVIYKGSTTVTTEGTDATEIAVDITESAAGVTFAYDGSVLTLTDKFAQDDAVSIELVAGSVKVADPTQGTSYLPEFGFAYAMHSAASPASTTYYADALEGAVTLTDATNDEVVIYKAAAEASVTDNTRTIAFDSAFSSETGLTVSVTDFALSGEIAGDITITGTVTVGTYTPASVGVEESGGLVIASGATVLFDNAGATLSIGDDALLTNEGAIDVETPATTGTAVEAKIAVTSTETEDDQRVLFQNNGDLTVADFAEIKVTYFIGAIAGIDYDYASKSTNDYILKAFDDGIAPLKANEVVVISKSVEGGLDVGLGTTTDTGVDYTNYLNFSSDYTGTVEIAADATPSAITVSGTIETGTVTVNGAVGAAGTLAVESDLVIASDASLGGTDGIALDVAETGTVTVNAKGSADGSKAGSLTIVGSAGTSNDGTIVNNGTVEIKTTAFVNNGTVENNGDLKMAAAITNNGTIQDNDGATYSVTTADITNGTDGKVVVADDKADALAIAAVMDTGSTVTGTNWTLKGAELTLTGDVSGQYFAATDKLTVKVQGDIEVSYAIPAAATGAPASLFSGAVDIKAAAEKVASSLTVNVTAAENQAAVAFAGAVTVSGIALDVTGDIGSTTVAGAISIGAAGAATTVTVNGDVNATTLTVAGDDKSVNTVSFAGKVTLSGAVDVDYADVTFENGFSAAAVSFDYSDVAVNENGITATGAVAFGTDATAGSGCSVSIVGGINASTQTVGIYYTNGTIAGGITTTGATIKNSSLIIESGAGAPISTITDVDASNLDLRLSAVSEAEYALTITGTTPFDETTTVIAEGLSTNTADVKAMIIVMGGTFNSTISDQKFIFNGVASTPAAGSIYLMDVETIIPGSAVVLPASNPIEEGTGVYNILSEAMAAPEADILFVTLADVDLSSSEITRNIAFSKGVTGDVKVADGITLTINGAYGAYGADNGFDVTLGSGASVEIVGAFYGTVNGIATGTEDGKGVTNAAFTNDNGTVKVSVATTKAVTGTIVVDYGDTVTLAAGTLFQGTIGDVTLNFTAISDMTFSKAALPEEETPAEPETPAVTNTRALAQNADTGAEEEKPQMEVTGDMELQSGENYELGGITIRDSAITVVEGGKAVITVKGELTLAGDIVLGENVTIKVEGTAVLNIASGANVSGAEGAISLTTGKIVVADGATVAEGVVTVDKEQAGTTAANQDEFLSVLQFQDEVTLTQDIPLTEGAFEAVNKTINLNGFKLTVDDGFTLTLGEGTDVVAGAKADGTAGTIDVTGTGKLVVGKADVFAVVTYEADANIDTTNAKVTDLSGDALPEQGVGFGSTLNIGADTVFSMTSKNSINVYGTLNVAGSLTVGSGAYIAVYSCGAMNVSGDITAVGDITVDGAAEITGDMTVTGTLTVAETGEFSVPGTLNMNGTLVGAITYAGTVNIGTADVAGKVGGAAINMMDGALLNVVNSTGTVTVAAVSSYEDPAEPEEGYVAPAEVVTSMTLAGVKGLTVTAEEYAYELVFKEMGLDLNIDAWVASLKISGTMTAGTVTADGVLEIDGSLTVQAGSVVSDGYLFVDEANTLTVQAGASVTNNGVAVIDGTADITAAAAADAVLKGEGAVYAAYYSVTAETGVTGTYAAFDAAVAEISGADGKKVTVYGMQVSSGADVAEGTVVIDAGAYLFVEGTLVFSPTAGIDNSANATDPVDDVRNIVVAGTVTLNDSTVSKLVDADVEAEVIYGQAPVKNYTSLANAIASGQTEISLNDDVVVDGKLEIPEDITVKSEVYGFTVNAGGELLVNGSVQLTGTDNGIVQMPAVPATGTEAAKEAGKITVDGMGYIYVPTTSPYFDSVGAYYQKNIAEADAEPEVVAVIATIDKAAADSANVYAEEGIAAIVVNGAVTADGPLSFTAPEGVELLVGVVGDSSLTAESITLSENAAVTVAGGVVDADFVCGDSALTLDKAAGTFAVAPVVPEEGAEAVLGITANTISGDITVAAGTVHVVAGVSLADADGSVLSIAQGATLAVPAEAVLAVSSDDALNVAGTLEVAGTVESFGDVTVTGTVTVTGSIAFYDALTVTGTVALADDAAETAEILVLGDAVVGEKPTALGGTSVGTMTGATVGTGGSIKAYAGTEVADIDGDSTVLNIRQKGTADYYGYMTVYVQKGADVKLTDFLYAEAFSLNGLDTGLAYPVSTQNTGLYKAGNWYSSSDLIFNTALNDLNTVGDYAAVYAQVGLVEVSITVAQGNGLTVYIDGMPVSSLMGQGGSVSLTIGTHKVSYDVNAGYTDKNVVMTFNGQPVQNGEITIGTGSAGYILSVTGAEAASGETTPVDPVINVETNDELTLTDYLLIVLVVLIVIMAIIVALRLMRS